MNILQAKPCFACSFSYQRSRWCTSGRTQASARTHCLSGLGFPSGTTVMPSTCRHSGCRRTLCPLVRKVSPMPLCPKLRSNTFGGKMIRLWIQSGSGYHHICKVGCCLYLNQWEDSRFWFNTLIAIGFKYNSKSATVAGCEIKNIILWQKIEIWWNCSLAQGLHLKCYVPVSLQVPNMRFKDSDLTYSVKLVIQLSASEQLWLCLRICRKQQLSGLGGNTKLHACLWQVISTQQLHCFVTSSLLPMLSLGSIMTVWEEELQPIWSIYSIFLLDS